MVKAIVALVAAWVAVMPALTVQDLEGKSWTPLAPAHGTIDLLIFVSADCPISARYSPEINRILRDYAQAQHVQAFLIYADPNAERSAVRANLKAFHDGLAVPAIIDSDMRLTIAVDAKVTPTAAIYTDAGRSYFGRIDNLYEEIGKNRREATEHDLRDALNAVLAGRPVKTPETRAIGCFIERDLK